ncbi:hypothetical protein KI387_021238, partial [Taxus chinensis]
EEDDIDVFTIVDVVGGVKSVERGTEINAKDGIMGKGGIIVDKVIIPYEVGIISDEVNGESVIVVEMGVGVGRYAEVDVDTTDFGMGVSVGEIVDVGRVSME